jgi:hypothetical protein
MFSETPDEELDVEHFRWIYFSPNPVRNYRWSALRHVT